MADTKISDLTGAADAATDMELPVSFVADTSNRKVTVMQLLAAGRYAPGSFSVPTGGYMVMARNLTLTSTQQATLAGTATLRILD